MRRSISTLQAGLPVGLFVLAAWSPARAADEASSVEFFETRVRPILANRCQGCHGAKSRGGLTLDSRAAALKGGGTGPAILPGNARDSLVGKAIRREDDLDMPPDEALPPEEVRILSAWIDAGAPWPEEQGANRSKKAFEITPADRAFWSFAPLRQPQVPGVDPDLRRRVRTPVDAFLFASMGRAGIKPAEEASAETLLRRVTIDLTGLSPSVEAVRAFVKAPTEAAYQKVVERLLASPEYGERWGRHWLDVMRYGEDDPISADPYPNAFRFRDFVIDAFNRDMPFDELVMAHIAGDTWRKGKHAVATGWAALGPYFGSGGNVPQSVSDEWNDRIDTLGRGFLGLTVACARCHDHKYDPISTRDYYALAGIFHATRYTETPLASPDKVAAWKAYRARHRSATDALGRFDETQAELLFSRLAAQTSDYVMAAHAILGPSRQDLRVVASAMSLDPETLSRWVEYLGRTEHDHPFVAAWPSLLGASSAEVRVFADRLETLSLDILREKRAVDAANRAILERQRLSPPPEFKRNYGENPRPPSNTIEGKAIHRDRKAFYLDLFETTRDLSNEGFGSHIGIYVHVAEALERFLSPADRAERARLRAAVVSLEKNAPPALPFIHALQDNGRTDADVNIQLRGNPAMPGEKVPRRFLEVLSVDGDRPLQPSGSGRLEIARQIARHPLTARVMVNRVWQQHFGVGLVATASNFGVLGERPSHPELLEYLTSRFVAQGYSLKALHRLLVLSTAYRLSSEIDPAAHAIDPQVRLRWRMVRRRLTVEAIRDTLLQVAGLLDRTRGGASFPDLLTGMRRSVYGTVSRNHTHELAALFDFPEPIATSEGRQATNVPLQKLVFLNSDLVTTCSEAIVKRLPKGTVRARIEALYLLLFARRPTENEREVGGSYLLSLAAEGSDDDAWKSYVHALLGTNAFIFVD